MYGDVTGKIIKILKSHLQESLVLYSITILIILSCN